jgi:hypothetical protein
VSVTVCAAEYVPPPGEIAGVAAAKVYVAIATGL